MKHIVTFGTNAIDLHFPESFLYDEYENEIKKIKVKYFKLLRSKYGYWACSQNKYVKSLKDLNKFDKEEVLK